jgi:hypothetical protein
MKHVLRSAVRLGMAAFVLVGLGHAPRARAEHVRVTNPNAVSVEFLGRGMLYSIGFDRVVSDDLVAGVGIGSTSLRTLADADTGVSTALLPVYANYYFMRDGGSPFATLGATIVTNSSAAAGLKSTYGEIEFNTRAVLATFGAGYEVRTDARFLFRAGVYGIYAKSLSPWGGLTLGYCF